MANVSLDTASRRGLIAVEEQWSPSVQGAEPGLGMMRIAQIFLLAGCALHLPQHL